MPHEIPEYMSANYVRDKTSVDILWKQLSTLQDIASNFGIDNIFQDNGAEILQQLIYLNMKAVPGREGNDGVDINGCEWEMKSLDISKGNAGITTNHHLNEGIIEKYRTVPWSISLYDGIQLKKIYVVSNEQLQPIFREWEAKLQDADDLNNPKIPLNYIEEHGILIYQEGDEYPIDITQVLDTRRYVPAQQALFAWIRAEKEAKDAEAEAAKANESAEKARQKANEKALIASNKAADAERIALEATAGRSAIRAAEKAAESAQRSAQKAEEKAREKEAEAAAKSALAEEKAAIAATKAAEKAAVFNAQGT